ncbi:hypothetical protein OEZ85_013244 [Tetradesmus obliquus]|uniref:Sushi domain-containing protein n=1 Tax=Tetradesmus obliquus TaxID=3088 RepID=A0ABY8U5A7_TETOB|nr:hypothetical protein OEZ85_013244 [Tetradesmus obliquus]
MLGGHLPSLHSLAQAEHLLGVHNSLWPRNSGWSREVGLWLGFFTHLGWNGGCEYYTEEIQGWGQYNPYKQNGWIMSVPPEEIARRSPRAWSDWTAPDYPGMLLWSPQCEGRVLNVTRDVDSGRKITTFPSPRYYGRPYVCALTKPGFGYVIEANATYGTVCPVGTYNSAGNKLPCTPCPGSLTQLPPAHLRSRHA